MPQNANQRALLPTIHNSAPSGKRALPRRYSAPPPSASAATQTFFRLRQLHDLDTHVGPNLAKGHILANEALGRVCQGQTFVHVQCEGPIPGSRAATSEASKRAGQ